MGGGDSIESLKILVDVYKKPWRLCQNSGILCINTIVAMVKIIMKLDQQ